MSGQNNHPLPGKPLTPYTLLHWQFILLFAGLGTLFSLSNLWALLAAGMLALAYFLKTTPSCFNKTFSAQAKALAVFGLAFGLGAGLALFASPSSPHNYPALQKTLLEYKKAIPLTATVAQVDSMPDARLRIILQDVEIQLSPDFTDNFADNFAGNDFVKLEAEANKSKKAKMKRW